VADLDSRTPVNGDGFFRIGSKTKTFIAVVVLQLVAEHRLSLDDTVGRWLPGVVHGNGNDGSKITVGELLQHPAACTTTPMTCRRRSPRPRRTASWNSASSYRLIDHVMCDHAPRPGQG
jgi:D-alanyl-D-alanine carboxypeptidase